AAAEPARPDDEDMNKIDVNAAASRYRGTQVTTSGPVQLVAMLFDGALRFVHEAGAAMGERDRARAGERIARALAIVDGLAATLDVDQAPELADNLLALYGYCSRRLLEANIAQDPAVLAEVAAVLSPLREAWVTLAKEPSR